MPRFPQLQGQDGNTHVTYTGCGHNKNGLLKVLRGTLPKEGTKKITALIASAFHLLLL